jgi:hypothetical protein
MPYPPASSTMSAMSDSDDWAIAVSAKAILEGQKGRTERDDARILAERLTSNVMLHGPTETFSQRMPTYSPPHEDEGLSPIDKLYGRYVPESRLIEIFVNSIRRGAQQFGWEFADLLKIVGIQEYAHAIVHIGIAVQSIEDLLSTFLPGQISTDWGHLRKIATRLFLRLMTKVTNFLPKR